jgi:hypothetical protein
MQTFVVRSIDDLDRIGEAVGLPVGPRKGRSKTKKEWYVLLAFLKGAIPSGMFDLPITVRNGSPPEEPDFVITRDDVVVDLLEVTEATDEADQQGMTAFEASGKSAALVGEFGGRFADGVSRPGLAWAEDVIESIKRKSGKAIYKTSSASRHLLVYPNSNASRLLNGERGEREAIDDLRTKLAKDCSLVHMVNGTVIHVLGAYFICIDALGDMKVLTRAAS